MNNDNYKIIISISHHRISFEYWQRDGENKLVPIPNGSWPAPLAFYCSETGIIIGEDAERAAHTGTKNAFDNYFERLIDDITYTIAGQTRPIRNLLLDASESIFHDFFRHVLLNRFGSLSDNRANMPLMLVCESDIKPNERALLQGLFKDSGYNRVKVVDYDRYINRYIKESLSNEYICDKVVVAWSEGSNLTFSIFGVNNDSLPIVKSFENLGIDPRKEFVEQMIWERIIGQNPWLQKNNEEVAISKAASDFLNSSLPLVNDTILLSDGQTYHYSLNRNTVDYIHNTDGVSIKDTLEQFLKENGITNRSKVLLLLRGLIAGNSYFEQNLSPGFSKTIKSDKKLRDNIMNLIIHEAISGSENNIPNIPPITILPAGDEAKVRIKLLSKKWRQVKAEANGKIRSGQNQIALQILKDFLSECDNCSGAEGLRSEIKIEIGKIDIPDIQPSTLDTSRIRDLERKWREIKATAKGKVRSGNKKEARSILQIFLNSVKSVSGTEELVMFISKELSEITDNDSLTTSSNHTNRDINPNGKYVHGSSAARSKGDWQAIGDRTHSQAVKDIDYLSSDNKSEGGLLIAQGKYKEARDWYRSHNDSNKARILSEIIRSKKGVDLRKSSIGEYRKSKNRDQINRIIQEIQEFIVLCNKVGIDSKEYKQLLLDYRKI